MQQSFDKFLMFRNRLEKVYRHIGRQARRQGIGCFRFYDHDLPEFPFIIENYENRLYVSEYKRRHGFTTEQHTAWMNECLAIISSVTGVAQEAVFVKLRQRNDHRERQYQKISGEKHEFVVSENGLSFIVNLSDYLDTGLFLDHRLTRQMVREETKGKKVLNLFCYTGSFSVYATAGGASEVHSVDLSKTYLDWAKRNMELNFPEGTNHQVIHADVLQYLKSLPSASFDLIVMDPPTFSNSKRMEEVLDIQRDHVGLINDCLSALTPDGVLYFSTNYTKFRLNDAALGPVSVRDITTATTPFDFTGKLKRPCFKISKT